MLPQSMFPAIRDPECACPPRIVSYVGGTENNGDILIYNATTGLWEVGAPNPGDITAVNTTLPLTGGAASGAVTLDINTFTGDSGAGGLEGTVPAPAAGDAAANKFLKADGTWTAITADITAVNTTLPLTGGSTSGSITLDINNFTGDAGAGGLDGAVPAPAAGDTAAKKYLFADGTWKAVADADLPVTLANHTLTSPLTYNVAEYHQTLTDQANIDWNMNSGGSAQITLGASRNFNAPTNLRAGATYMLAVIQGGAGSYTINWNGIFKWPNATPPVLSTVVGAKDLIAFWCPDGTNLWGVINNAFA